jgi:hypothetical protein
MRIDFENIKESELDSDTIIIDENEASFHQHIHDLFFIKKPLNAETWYSFIIKNFRRVLKLTVAFVIHGDPEKLARNAEDLSEYLLGLYREYFPIRWQANILQIKYLNQHHQPLTINELEAWAKHWCVKGEYYKKAVLECIDTIVDFTDGKMEFRECCFFTELEIVGSFRGARYLVSNGESGVWEMCKRTVVNSADTKIYLYCRDSSSPDPCMETLLTFYLSPITKKIKISHTQTQNWIFNRTGELPESFEIENASVSHVAIRDNYQYFELNLGTLKSSRIVDTSKVESQSRILYKVNKAKFREKKSWLLHDHLHPNHLDYYICKSLSP